MSFVTLASVVSISCGKKGPPLPPLVKIPAAPADFLAERRGSTVDLQFTVPAANTDNTRPANVGRVDVYAMTSRTPLSPDQIVKHGVRVASVPVKAPRDPDQTIEEDEPPADMEPPEGHGLDQGAVGRVSEELTREAMAPVQPPRERNQPAPANDGEGPLLPAQTTPLARTYVAVAVTTRDRKGPSSKLLSVPLVPPPPAPASPTVIYDEKTITVTWPPVAGRAQVQAAPDGDTLPSTSLGPQAVAIAYNVYDSSQKPPAKLTATPTADATFADTRIVWGAERCYAVRAVETYGNLTIEGEAAAARCKTLKDTFPPAAPTGLQSSPLEGAINLIWDANTEADLAGYIVFRGPSPDALTPLVDAPIQVTTFLDKVPSGERFTYVVKAVDRAGNASAASKPVDEAAR